jgi:uncharacterized repeat protein (TIGR03803 family)
MPTTKFPPGISALGLLFTVICFLTTAHTQTETVLYSFTTNPSDGTNPFSGLTLDAKGNLYGTTYFGGTFGFGTVFKISPTGTETVLYNFTGGADGAYPYGSDLIRDKAGNLYGTTNFGGANGEGTVFMLSPSGSETVLHSFAPDGVDGFFPFGGLVMDKAGNLYGTTLQGGAKNFGTVFKLTPAGVETILHSFQADADGAYPSNVTLALGKKNVLYGTTNSGGAGRVGTVFKVTQTGSETVLHTFAIDGVDGYFPFGGVVLDKKGNLYGTTHAGGTFDNGTVFKITPAGTETIMHNFTGGADGGEPYAHVALDKLGNLYGTTYFGGSSGVGTVFSVDPTGKEGVLHSFKSNPDGAYPVAGVVLDKKNNLYGTTYQAGLGYGTVYKIGK